MKAGYSQCAFNNPRTDCNFFASTGSWPVVDAEMFVTMAKKRSVLGLIIESGWHDLLMSAIGRSGTIPHSREGSNFGNVRAGKGKPTVRFVIRNVDCGRSLAA